MYVTRKSAFSVRNHLEVVVGPNRYGNMAICHGSQSFVPAQIYLHSILVCPTNSSRRIWFWKSVKWFVHANDGTFCWKMRIESMHVFSPFLMLWSSKCHKKLHLPIYHLHSISSHRIARDLCMEMVSLSSGSLSSLEARAASTCHPLRSL